MHLGIGDQDGTRTPPDSRSNVLLRRKEILLEEYRLGGAKQKYLFEILFNHVMSPYIQHKYISVSKPRYFQKFAVY